MALLPPPAVGIAPARMGQVKGLCEEEALPSLGDPWGFPSPLLGQCVSIVPGYLQETQGRGQSREENGKMFKRREMPYRALHTWN